MKGILFKVYSTVGDKEVYERVNKRSLQYKNKVNTSISEEGYVIQENTLVLADQLQERYKREIENWHQVVYYFSRVLMVLNRIICCYILYIIYFYILARNYSHPDRLLSNIIIESFRIFFMVDGSYFDIAAI